MFIVNKYHRIYFDIVNKAKSENRKKGEIYYESHHIVPRSLGGNNSKTNLVLLTAKEHFICHLILVRITEGDNRRKMAWAMWNLSINPGNENQHRYKLSSRSFETVRKLYSDMSRGHVQSEETKAKRRESCRKNARPRFGEDNYEFRGYYITPWGRFPSATQAAKEGPYGIDRKRIVKACNSETMILQIRKPITLPQEWIGKTYRELGFSFESI